MLALSLIPIHTHTPLRLLTKDVKWKFNLKAPMATVRNNNRGPFSVNTRNRLDLKIRCIAKDLSIVCKSTNVKDRILTSPLHEY